MDSSILSSKVFRFPSQIFDDINFKCFFIWMSKITSSTVLLHIIDVKTACWFQKQPL